MSIEAFPQEMVEEKMLEPHEFEFFERINLHAEAKGYVLIDNFSNCYTLELGKFNTNI